MINRNDKNPVPLGVAQCRQVKPHKARLYCPIQRHLGRHAGLPLQRRRRETWITPCERMCNAGSRETPPFLNYVVVQPATGLRRGVGLSTLSYASLTQGYPYLSPTGKLR